MLQLSRYRGLTLRVNALLHEKAGCRSATQSASKLASHKNVIYKDKPQWELNLLSDKDGLQFFSETTVNNQQRYRNSCCTDELM